MNYGKLILSGGGDVEISFLLDQKYFSLLRNDAKILYIPIALNRTQVGFEACYDWFSGLVSKHTTGRDIDFSMLLENDEIPNLKDYDSIYIGGGNTYKLLDYIYKKNLDKKLIEYVNNGGIIYGGSAGAMILGKSIKTAEEENDKNYPNSNGLNLLEGKSVICHYDESLDRKILEIAKRTGFEIIAIPEDAGLVFDYRNKSIETINKVFVFDAKNKKLL